MDQNRWEGTDPEHLLDPISAQLWGQVAGLELWGQSPTQQAIATLDRIWNSVGPLLVSQPCSQDAWQIESHACKCFSEQFLGSS